MEGFSIGNFIVTMVCAALSSTGLWAFMSRFGDRKCAQSQMLIGLGHDRIVFLGMKYIERGHIYQDEYENLHDYLYKPYEKLGGNGSAKRIMDEVDRLELRSGHAPYDSANKA